MSLSILEVWPIPIPKESRFRIRVRFVVKLWRKIRSGLLTTRSHSWINLLHFRVEPREMFAILATQNFQFQYIVDKMSPDSQFLNIMKTSHLHSISHCH